jgi:hypothetical protein
MIAGVDSFKKGRIAVIDDGCSIAVQPFASFAEIAQYPGLYLIPRLLLR